LAPSPAWRRSSFRAGCSRRLTRSLARAAVFHSRGRIDGARRMSRRLVAKRSSVTCGADWP
jgi:hypothetical protein